MTERDVENYRLPRQHVYEGITLAGNMAPATLDRVKQFVFKNDTVLVAYPKNGMTWIQEMVWIITNGGDIEAAKLQDVRERVPFLEQHDAVSREEYMSLVEKGARPATIKTHLPAYFFARPLQDHSAKFIILVRNPKDTLVSLYHFYRSALMNSYPGTWDQFFELAVREQLIYKSYFYIYETWIRLQQNPALILWVKYEDMHKDLLRELKRIAEFLGKTLPDDKLQEIIEHGSFRSMQKNNMTNYMNYKLSDANTPFMRAGKVGEWKEFFNEEQNNFIDKMYEKIFTANGFTLDFE